MEAVTELFTNGASVAGFGKLLLFFIGIMGSYGLTMLAQKYVAYSWLKSNQEIARKRVWVRVGTSTGYFDALLLSYSLRYVQMRSYNPTTLQPMGEYMVPTDRFVRDPIHILDANLIDYKADK